MANPGVIVIASLWWSVLLPTPAEMAAEWQTKLDGLHTLSQQEKDQAEAVLLRIDEPSRLGVFRGTPDQAAARIKQLLLQRDGERRLGLIVRACHMACMRNEGRGMPQQDAHAPGRVRGPIGPWRLCMHGTLNQHGAHAVLAAHMHSLSRARPFCGARALPGARVPSFSHGASASQRHASAHRPRPHTCRTTSGAVRSGRACGVLHDVRVAHASIHGACIHP